jgi:hypothetical protein
VKTLAINCYLCFGKHAINHPITNPMSAIAINPTTVIIFNLFSYFLAPNSFILSLKLINKSKSLSSLINEANFKD